MAARTIEEAKRVIDAVDFTPYLAKAKKHAGFFWDADKAIQDYKQFLLLIWFNNKAGNTEVIVPTERADVIWHEHILFTRDYAKFCDDLVGHFVHHMPGLEKGTEPFNKAVEHTKQVQRDNSGGSSSCGYSPGYMGGCGASTPPTSSTPSKGVCDSGSHGSHHDSGASCSSGSSCGGAGCGGGGCGGG